MVASMLVSKVRYVGKVLYCTVLYCTVVLNYDGSTGTAHEQPSQLDIDATETGADKCAYA